FRAAGALVEIDSGPELAGAVGALLQDRSRAADLGRRARKCSEAQRGATSTAVAKILCLHAAAVPRFLPVAPVRAGLWVWHRAAAVARLWQTSRRARLRAPVISVGNLSMGG